MVVMGAFETYCGGKDAIRAALARRTVAAMAAIPLGRALRIIDMGSGTGVVSLMLADRCPADFTCIDIDAASLSILKNNAAERGLSDRVHALRGDIGKLEYPPASFDIVLSEGSVQFVGFRHALSVWGALLPRGGHMVIHCDGGEREAREQMMRDRGYDIVSVSEYSIDDWINEYFLPLSCLLISSLAAHERDNAFMDLVSRDANDTATSLENPSSLGSLLYILKKI